MNNFIKGMDTIGQLFPEPYPLKDYPAQSSAWESVAASFRQTGDSLRRAIKECSDTKPENKKTPEAGN